MKKFLLKLQSLLSEKNDIKTFLKERDKIKKDIQAERVFLEKLKKDVEAKYKEAYSEIKKLKEKINLI